MIRNCITLFLSLLLLSVCSVALAAIVAPDAGDKLVKSTATQVSGKVTVGVDKTPVAGVRVGAYPLGSAHLRGEPPFVSLPTAEDGLFTLTLPSDRYFFIAEGDRLYSFYGRNPVSVPESGLEGMNLSLIERNPKQVEAEPLIETGIFGHAYSSGEPVAGVIISVYTDLNSQLKGQGLGMAAPTAADGLFEAPLPPGTYYLVARKRQSGKSMGPLSSGDLFGYYADNPVTVKPGQVLRVPLALIEVPEKVAQMADSMFGATRISGRVVDSAGQPVAGIQVLLYTNSMMLNRPLFVSQPSGADGRYVISFPQGGTYWLAARNQLGGPPLPGQLFGRYLGSPDGSVRLKSGQGLENIELVVEEME